MQWNDYTGRDVPIADQTEFDIKCSPADRHKRRQK